MSSTNHKLFFPHEEGDDLFELYEERLFEDKQFFTSKPIIISVFNKRFQKMMQRENAFRSLTKTTSPAQKSSKQSAEELYINQDSIPEAYREFQLKKAEILREVYTAENINHLIGHAEKLTQLLVQYSRLWYLAHDFSSDGILISKEPNPGLLAQAIKSFEQVEGKNVDDLQQLTYTGKETLLHEAKRLSLWRKKEIFDGKF